MLAVERRQSPADVQPQPEQRRQLRVSQIGVQIAGDVNERLLEHVGSVNPGPEPWVDPQLDHATEPIAIAIEYRRQRPWAATAQPLDGVRCVAGSVFHESPHTPYPRRPETRTEKAKLGSQGGVRARAKALIASSDVRLETAGRRTEDRPGFPPQNIAEAVECLSLDRRLRQKGRNNGNDAIISSTPHHSRSRARPHPDRDSRSAGTSPCIEAKDSPRRDSRRRRAAGPELRLGQAG